MNKLEDPAHLRQVEEVPPRFAEALREEAQSGPTEEQAARLAAALGIAPAVMTPAAAPVTSKAATWSLVVGGGAAIVGVAVLGVWWMSKSDDRPAPTPPVVAPAPVIEPAPAPIEVAPAPVVHEEVIVEQATPRRVRRDPPPAPPASESVETIAQPTPPPAEEIDDADRLRQENALIQRAEAALARDPALALRLADEHRSRFPDGVMVQEREVVAIDALLRSNRRAEAQARADAFFARHSGSVHARRIQRLLQQSP
jgi:hypothetical protein